MKTLFNLSEEIPPDSREEQKRYFERVFGNANPLVIEIGSGNGHFLVELAVQNPGLNYIGTEMLGGRAKKFNRKVEKRNLHNILIFKGDARRFVWEFLYDETIVKFLLMFPDPWPKKRHHKHRLLRSAFIEMLRRRLVHGGLVCITTDDAPYRDWIIDEFGKCRGFESLHEKGYTLYTGHFPESLFEKRFREEERQLYLMEFEKE
jgi:tRNA (guanine-N7-)-methyltransferase